MGTSHQRSARRFRVRIRIEAALRKRRTSGMRIEPFGQGLGRIADPRELDVETVEAGREGVLHDLAGDVLGSDWRNIPFGAGWRCGTHAGTGG